MDNKERFSRSFTRKELADFDHEIRRFQALSYAWDRTETVAVLMAWLGVNGAKEMNDYLASKYGEPVLPIDGV
jgi:hypothetical protein